MRFDAQFAWEHVEDDPLTHSRHDAWTVNAAPPRMTTAQRLGYRLAFLVSTMLILAGTFHFWRDAKAQQHAADRELAVALDAVLAPGGSDAQSLLAPAVTQVNRRSDLAYVDVYTSAQGYGEIVLRRTTQGWQRLAPADGAWGAQLEFTTGMIAVTYWEKDAPVVRAAAVHADARSTYIRHILGLGEPATQLAFRVAPDAWGMTAGSDDHQQIVLRDALGSDAARIAYLTEAFLRAQIAAALHELAGPATATTSGQQLQAALEDWLVANAYPRMAEELTAPIPAPGRPSSATPAGGCTAIEQLLSADTTADFAAMIDELVATRGYAGLGELLHAVRQGDDLLLPATVHRLNGA